MSPYAMQRDPRFFPEPERFMPERWLEPRATPLPRFAYFPFGGGPRVCIGNHFAMMEIALVLATMMQQVELTVVPGYQAGARRRSSRCGRRTACRCWCDAAASGRPRGARPSRRRPRPDEPEATIEA